MMSRSKALKIVAVYVLRNALADPGATVAFTVIILVLITMVTISSVASTSRQTFAFA